MASPRRLRGELLWTIRSLGLTESAGLIVTFEIGLERVEAQLRLPVAGIRPVAFVAMTGQDGPDLSSKNLKPAPHLAAEIVPRGVSSDAIQSHAPVQTRMPPRSNATDVGQTITVHATASGCCLFGSTSSTGRPFYYCCWLKH